MPGSPVVVVCDSLLSAVYGSMCTQNYDNGTISTSYQNYVANFFESLGTASASTDYGYMAAALSAYVTNPPLSALGYPSGAVISGLRVQVIDADGKTAYDSAAGASNLYSNINIPKSDFVTSGKYLINENQNTRTYNQAAALSQSGQAFQVKYSSTVLTNQLYLAVRQGTSVNNPIGNIVISANYA
jgi:hypothetical protein